jgi:hypothetical protein
MILASLRTRFQRGLISPEKMAEIESQYLDSSVAKFLQ